MTVTGVILIFSGQVREAAQGGPKQEGGARQEGGHRLQARLPVQAHQEGKFPEASGG